MIISVFRSLRDRRPDQRDITHHSLRQMLDDPKQVTVKDGVPLWSPCIYRPGATRSWEGVEAVTAIVLDYDDGTVTPRQAFDRVLKRQHPVHGMRPMVLVHTSYSHTAEHPRFRLIMPMLHPVPAEQWSRVWQGAVRDFGDGCDPSCKDASRMYYLPSRRPDAPSETYAHMGYMLDPQMDHMPARASPPVPARPRLPPRNPLEAMAMQRTAAATDPDERRQMALRLGAEIAMVGAGEVARGATCPACGRQSLWWHITPHRQTRAYCDHRQTCGATFGLWEL